MHLSHKLKARTHFRCTLSRIFSVYLLTKTLLNEINHYPIWSVWSNVSIPMASKTLLVGTRLGEIVFSLFFSFSVDFSFDGADLTPFEGELILLILKWILVWEWWLWYSSPLWGPMITTLSWWMALVLPNNEQYCSTQAPPTHNITRVVQIL